LRPREQKLHCGAHTIHEIIAMRHPTVTAVLIGLAGWTAWPVLPAVASDVAIPGARANARHLARHLQNRVARGPVRTVMVDRRVPAMRRLGAPLPTLMYDPTYRSESIYGDAFYQDPVGFYVHNTFYWGRDYNPQYQALHFRVCRSQDYAVTTPDGGPEVARMVHC
jgi:hypothetical protein